MKCKNISAMEALVFFKSFLPNRDAFSWSVNNPLLAGMSTNTMRSRNDSCIFVGGIFILISFSENCCTWIQNSLKFLYFYSHIPSFYMKYFVLPYSRDVSTLSYIILSWQIYNGSYPMIAHQIKQICLALPSIIVTGKPILLLLITSSVLLVCLISAISALLNAQSLHVDNDLESATREHW